MSSTLTTILNSINKKAELMEPEEIAISYPAFVVNMGMSYFSDTIMFANEMNMHPSCPGWGQYMFYYHGVTRKSRFSKWYKRGKIKHLDLIKEYYNYGNVKAEEALELLTDDQIAIIQERMYKGGRTKVGKG